MKGINNMAKKPLSPNEENRVKHYKYIKSQYGTIEDWELDNFKDFYMTDVPFLLDFIGVLLKEKK